MMAKYRGDVSPITLEPRGTRSAPNDLLNRMFECSAVQDVHKALPSMDSGAPAAVLAASLLHGKIPTGWIFSLGENLYDNLYDILLPLLRAISNSSLAALAKLAIWMLKCPGITYNDFRNLM